MIGFKEWLVEQAVQEGSIAERRKLIEQWTDSVANLFAKIIAWLDEDDTRKVLTVQAGKIQRREEELGVYDVATMRISLSAKAVDLIPLAKNVVAGMGKRGELGFRAEGRVDMTNGAEKYMLYRVVTSEGEKWVLVDDDKYSVKDLTKETFEAALQDLLS